MLGVQGSMRGCSGVVRHIDPGRVSIGFGASQFVVRSQQYDRSWLAVSNPSYNADCDLHRPTSLLSDV